MAPKRKSAAPAKDLAAASGKTAKRNTTKASAGSASVEASNKPAKRRSTSKAATEPAEDGKMPARQRKGSKPAAAAADDDNAAAAKPNVMKPAELADHTTFFLVKDEPSDYSIEDLVKEKNQTAEWDGVRNYQARNIMQKMRKGNQVLFYRSGTKDPGVVGLMEVARDPYPDHTSWQKGSKGYDPKSSKEEPRWFMADFKLKRKFDSFVPLATLKQHKDTELAGLALLRISRLSVMPLTAEHFEFILQLAEEDAAT